MIEIQLWKGKCMRIVIFVGLLLVIFVLYILKNTMQCKFRDIYNPIKKDNSDYRFIEVDNIKTRSILKK